MRRERLDRGNCGEKDNIGEAMRRERLDRGNCGKKDKIREAIRREIGLGELWEER
jgi:hypothetical protein